MKCPDCGGQMILRSTKKFLTRNGKPKKFFGCSNWPKCKGIHGAHPDGRPLGIPASAPTKQARTELHRFCERIWGDWKTISQYEKAQMYDWFQKNAPKPHIAEMSIEDCEKTKVILKEYFNL